MTTTNTAALDTVIEHATETTKAAGERVREFAQIGVRKATEGFEQISKAAQTASEELNSQLNQARDGATKASLKLLEVAKEDADAGFAALNALLRRQVADRGVRRLGQVLARPPGDPHRPGPGSRRLRAQDRRTTPFAPSRSASRSSPRSRPKRPPLGIEARPQGRAFFADRSGLPGAVRFPL